MSGDVAAALAKEQTLVSVLVSVEETEAAMDVLDRKFGNEPVFRLGPRA
jgi:hypothetical protein